MPSDRGGTDPFNQICSLVVGYFVCEKVALSIFRLWLKQGILSTRRANIRRPVAAGQREVIR